MNQDFKDCFYFNRTERRGILSLLLIIVALIGWNLYLTYSPYQFPETESNLEQIYASLKLDSAQNAQSDKSSDRVDIGSLIKKQNQKDSLFPFDPNDLSVELWQRLGLSAKQAAVIKKYEAKGGRFRKNEDVQKMYTISEAMYQRLEPYINIAEDPFKKDTVKRFERQTQDSRKTTDLKRTNFKKYVRPIVDINLADSATFKTIYGIGPYFSGKMVSYRKELGGYHSKNQLTEIWGFSDSLLQAIDSQLVISRIPIDKIRVNQQAAAELKNHPYINWNLANSLVKIRAKHGKYENENDLKRSVLMTDSLLNKLIPYISFE